MSYNGPRLEDVQDAMLNASCMGVLGDSITYQPAGGNEAPLKAYVDYADALREIENGKVVEQDIQVEVLITQVPVQPNGHCRIKLGKIPGRIFKPINVRRNRSGDHWQFEVARVQ